MQQHEAAEHRKAQRFSTVSFASLKMHSLQVVRGHVVEKAAV